MRILNRLRPRLWRLVALNAAAVAAMFVVLAASPAPVHFPSTHWEAILLVCAAVLVLVGNMILTGAAVAHYVERGRQANTRTRNLEHLRRSEHFEVVADDGVIGIVDEVLATREGQAEVLIVGDGWFGARRFYMPARAISSIDERNRIVRVASAASAVATDA